jgi:hydroxymethylglutaryl-CoA lyase
VPALADADMVLAGIDRVPRVIYVALVPNVRGVQNAVATERRPDEVNGVVSASETHNIANINRTHEQSLAELPTMVKVAHDAGMKITMSLSTTFGCPFEGRVHEDVVMELVERFRNAGFDGISLADTTGMANPRQVRELVAKVLSRFPPPDECYYTLHFHNTRGMGLANVVAGIEAGVRSFDGSLAGLGGCPFAPGATGNICTEDMVNMLEDMGYDTRIDLAKLLAVARRIPAVVGHDTPGQVMKAGQTLELHEPPTSTRTP